MCTHVCMCINCGVFLSHCPPYLFLFFIMCVLAHVSLGTSADAHGGQGLRFPGGCVGCDLTWVMGTRLRFSRRADYVLSC